MMQKMARWVILDKTVDNKQRMSTNLLNFYHCQDFSIEGDAIEMDLRQPEVDNGKVSKRLILQA